MKQAILLVLLGSLPLRAVIVAGANGGGDNSNNTTSVQLEASLGIDGAFYDNVIRYSDASAVYLGWRTTVNGPRAYVLSAMHITFSNTMVINGVTYSVSRESISSSDLALLTLTQTSGIMPPLPITVLAAATPAIGTQIVMAGYGRKRAQDATTNASVSDAVAVSGGTGYTTNATTEKRWGTNTTENFGPPGQHPTSTVGSTTVTYSLFSTPPTGGWLTSNEAQAVVGDSGGGMFNMSGQLLGIMYAVSDPSVGGTQAFFGQATYFTNVPTYKAALETQIGGALIPEPSVLELAILGLSCWFVFKRVRRFS
jgi:hypothetical protein